MLFSTLFSLIVVVVVSYSLLSLSFFLFFHKDWEDFFAASDDDKVHSFLKLEEPLQCELVETTKPHETSVQEEEANRVEETPSSIITEGFIESPPSMTDLVAPEPEDEEELIEVSPLAEVTNNETAKEQPEAFDEEEVVEE